MFRILCKPEESKLAELSIKQREMLIAYHVSKYDLDFPPLRRRPSPIEVPRMPATPPNTPVERVVYG